MEDTNPQNPKNFSKFVTLKMTQACIDNRIALMGYIHNEEAKEETQAAYVVSCLERALEERKSKLTVELYGSEKPPKNEAVLKATLALDDEVSKLEWEIIEGKKRHLTAKSRMRTLSVTQSNLEIISRGLVSEKKSQWES